MKQTWFRPPAYRQFSLDADATDAPNRPDGTAARRLDGNPPTQDSMRGQAPAQPGAGQAEQHGLERIASERQEQPIAEQSTPDQRAQPAIKQLSTEQQDQRNTVQLTPERRAQPSIRHLATEQQDQHTAGQPAPEQRDQPAIKQLATEQQDQRTAVQLTPERRAQPAIGQRADCQDSTARPDARRGATKQGLRSARRRIERVLDRYGYYMAVGVCALMVFAGALIGTSGNAPSATPQSTQLTGEQVSDVPAEQPSSSDGLLGEDVSANAAASGDAAPHSLACWPLEGQVLTAHSLDALIYQPTLGVYATHAGIDIAGSAGQVVVACADGEVVRCWRESLLGNVVEVRGEDGVIMRYGNLASLDQASEGVSVSAGDVLGAIGASAMSESLLEPHLHFEVLVDGQSVSPEDWLPMR